MRGVAVVLLSALLLSGCIGTPETLEADTQADMESIARERLLAQHEDLGDLSLRAVHSVEARALEARAEEAATAPTGFLLTKDDPVRLDGQSDTWLFLYRHEEGGFAYAFVTDRSAHATGWMDGLTHPYFESLDGGSGFEIPTMDAEVAAARAKDDAALEGIADDEAWDIRYTLQHWPGREAPVWVVEAVHRFTDERRGVAIDAETQERLDLPGGPVRITKTRTGGVTVPPAPVEVFVDVPLRGYDRMQLLVDVQWGESVEIIDPHGTVQPDVRDLTLLDPLPGTWSFRFDSTTGIYRDGEIVACLDEHPPVRDGMQPRPCEA